MSYISTIVRNIITMASINDFFRLLFGFPKKNYNIDTNQLILRLQQHPGSGEDKYYSLNMDYINGNTTFYKLHIKARSKEEALLGFYHVCQEKGYVFPFGPLKNQTTNFLEGLLVWLADGNSSCDPLHLLSLFLSSPLFNDVFCVVDGNYFDNWE